MSLEAYRRVQQTAESPSQTEYRLFAQVTSALMRARDGQFSGAALMEPLDWNRRLWSTLSTDCGLPGNALPKELRAQIISLALWVNRYTSDVYRNPADIDALIDVNKAIMDGLALQASNAARAAVQAVPLQAAGA